MKGKLKELIIVVAFILMTPLSSFAENGVDFHAQIKVNYDCAESEADLILTFTISKGTSLSALSSACESLMSFYRELWSGEESLLKKMLPSKEDSRVDSVRVGSKAISGASTIIMLNEEFRKVEEQGLTVFPKDVQFSTREKIPLFEQCLLEDSSKNPHNKKDPNLENRIPRYRNNNISELRQKQLTANSNSITVSLLSFRSETGRFPKNIEELKSKGHLLIKLKNPFTNKFLSFNGENGPGTFQYSSSASEQYILVVLDGNNTPIRTQFITSSAPIQGVLSYTQPTKSGDAKPYTIHERIVRIYVYQIGQLLNSFYEQFSYLPQSVPYMESHGFAILNYINPFTNSPIKSAKRPDKGDPGDYFYLITGKDEYILVGFGESGRKIIEILHKSISKKDL